MSASPQVPIGPRVCAAREARSEYALEATNHKNATAETTASQRCAAVAETETAAAAAANPEKGAQCHHHVEMQTAAR
jgi:hypothetical protein